MISTFKKRTREFLLLFAQFILFVMEWDMGPLLSLSLYIYIYIYAFIYQTYLEQLNLINLVLEVLPLSLSLYFYTHIYLSFIAMQWKVIGTERTCLFLIFNLFLFFIDCSPTNVIWKSIKWRKAKTSRQSTPIFVFFFYFMMTTIRSCCFRFQS